MQKIINKIEIDDDIYYKVLNVLNNHIVHINIYQKVSDSFNEILPGEIDNKRSKSILSDKNGIVLNSDELKDFSSKIDDLRAIHESNINSQIIKKFDISGKIKLINSFAGITYCLIEFYNKPYCEVIGVILDEKGTVKETYYLTPDIMDLIVADISTKILLKNNPIYIQYSHIIMYGILKVEDIIAISELSIGAEDVSCIKTFGIEFKDNLYKFPDKTDESYKSNLQKMTQKIIEGLMSAILIDIIKKEKD